MAEAVTDAAGGVTAAGNTCAPNQNSRWVLITLREFSPQRPTSGSQGTAVAPRRRSPYGRSETQPNKTAKSVACAQLGSPRREAEATQSCILDSDSKLSPRLNGRSGNNAFHLRDVLSEGSLPPHPRP